MTAIRSGRQETYSARGIVFLSLNKMLQGKQQSFPGGKLGDIDRIYLSGTQEKHGNRHDGVPAGTEFEGALRHTGISNTLIGCNVVAGMLQPVNKIMIRERYAPGYVFLKKEVDAPGVRQIGNGFLNNCFLFPLFHKVPGRI